jgi:eukaryotic-like serine/threonine-protein kinase
MSTSHVDRNLLFGILALQMDFISRDALIAAMHAWVLHKQKPLGQILVEQGALASDVLTALDALVKKHLELHQDDPQQSLAAVGLPGGVQRELAQLSDADVHASLARLGAIAPAKPSQATTLPMPASASGNIRFEILRPHAWGGLGEVFVAQDREVNREVALKRLHERCADDAGSRARFLREAEITGGLEHPGIVPVYGLGTSEDGRPHYAMRFIRGETLKEAIKRFHSAKGGTESERRIELRQLLTRFIAVCNAVEYAHSRGVIHRDLKPSNIMLGKFGETLVVDWGLCKALGHREGEEPADERTLIPSSGSGSSETLPGSAIGTPAYMSPEQSEGRIDELGPASDVYSLGATLYTILTGKEPFESTVIGVILGKVQTGDFVPPRQRNPKVSRALDAICLKAMSLRPKDRYPSCAALASDIEHWLADEPVTAFQDPVSTRALRWVRRHRTAAATSAALIAAAFVGLLAGTALLGRANTEIRAAAAEAQRQRDDATKQRKVAESQRQAADVQRALAEKSARETRQTIDRFFTLVSESRLIDVPGTEPLRKELLNAALDYYRKLPKGDSGDAEVQAELAAANFRMAIIENNTGSDNWLPEFQRGLEITERLVALKTPVDKLKGFDAGVAGDMVGRTLKADLQSLAQFRKMLERAVELWERLHALKPRSVGIQNDLAALRSVLATLTLYAASVSVDVPMKQRLASEALTSHTRARDLWKSLAVEFPGNPRFRADLALQYDHIGNDQMYRSCFSESLAALREADTLGHALVRDFPEVSHYQVDLAANYRNLQTLYVLTKNVRRAIEAVREEMALREKLVADFPTVRAYKTDLSDAYQGRLTLVSAVLPQLISLRTSFLSVFDLYAELKEKQNALESGPSHGGLFQPAVTVSASPGGGRFPAINRHLGNGGFLPLKHLLDKTPKGLRAQLIDTYVERAKSGQRPGAKTYRMAAADLRWWADEQEAAVKLLQSYGQETPHDPTIVLSLVEACRSMTKGAGPSGPKPAELFDILFDSLKNPTLGQADAELIVQSIRQLDPEGKLAGPRWDALLNREEPSLRRLALRGLPGDASQLKRFAPAIEQSLADADAGVRAAAALRAWELNHQADKVVPILTNCLRDPASENRLAALSALASIGPSAQAALTSLQPLVGDLDGEIRIAAGLALWRVGHDPSAVKRLAADFQKRERSGDPSWVSELIGVGLEMGPAAQDALPALVETLPLTDSSEERRNEILRAVRVIDPLGTLAVPLWLRLSDGKSSSLRTTALTSLNDCAWSLATNADPKLRDPRRAAELAQIVVKKRPDVAAFWNTLGVALYRTGDWNASLAALSKSLEQTGPNSADGFFAAMARWQRGEKENAKKWYTAASRWAAKYAPTDQELGRFRVEAAALLKTPESLPVDNVDDLGIGDAFVEASGSAFAYHYRAATNADLGGFDRAADDLDKAIQLGDQSVNTGYQAALARLGHNDQRGFQTACAALIQTHAQEKQADMAHLAAWACAMAPHALDDFGPAIGLATRALKSDPNSASFLTGLGAVLYRAGRFDEGLKKLQQAEAVTQKAGEERVLIAYRWFFLAMAHSRLHHSSDAKLWLDKARQTADSAMLLHKTGTQELKWNRRLTLSLLRKEAEALVSGAETPRTASGSIPAGDKGRIPAGEKK